MKIAIMQPTYLPWPGYFELMANSDRFILFDDVQFAKKTWHSRNRIKGTHGELMLSVPVKTHGKQFQSLNQVKIDNAQGWAGKHFKAIDHSYRKAEYYHRYIGYFEAIYREPPSSLLDLNTELLLVIRRILGIETPMSRSSEIVTRDGMNEKIIDLCKHYSADTLYDAKGAADILDLPKYKEENITLEFQEYEPPLYSQLHGDFIPYLSVIDLLFNCGSESLNIIKMGRK